MGSSEFTFNEEATETPIDELFVRYGESDSSESIPQAEWSSLDLLVNYSDASNEKFELYAQGLYDPGSGEICAKYLPLSDSSVYRHPYYNYPSIKDPGICGALLDNIKKKVYADDGQELYMDLCKEMNIAPIRMFYRDLLGHTIDLSYYGLSERAVRAVCESLVNNQTVTRIDLTSNFLSLDACYHVGNLLGENHGIQEVVLKQCKLGTEGIRRVVANLQYRTTTLLDLSSNDLGDDGFEVLVESMLKGAIIKKLSVANNNLGHKSAVLFDDVLNQNNHFTHLDLSWNRLGIIAPASARILRSMSEGEELVELNMSFNYISNAGVLQLLMRAPKMQFLDLSKNNLKYDAVKFIVNGFRNSNLKAINLSRNRFSAEDALKILQGFGEGTAQKLYLDETDVEVDFIKEVEEIKSQRDVVITHGRVTRDFTIGKVPMKEIVVKRFEAITRSKSEKKPKLDFCVYFLTLQRKGIEFIELKKINKSFRQGRVFIDEGLLEELPSAFPGPIMGKNDRSVNAYAVCEYIRRLFPEKEPDPPTPEPEQEEPKKKKGKGKKGRR